jgi:hypothetical protein
MWAENAGPSRSQSGEAPARGWGVLNHHKLSNAAVLTPAQLILALFK